MSVASKKFLAPFAFSLDMIFNRGIGACALATFATPVVRFLSGVITRSSERGEQELFLRFCALMIFTVPGPMLRQRYDF